MLGTFETTSMPTKAASTKTVRYSTMPVLFGWTVTVTVAITVAITGHPLPGAPEDLDGGRRDGLAVAQHGHAGHDLVVPVRGQSALGPHQAEDVGHVACVEETGVGGHARGRVGHAHHVHAVVVHHGARVGERAVASRIGRHVHDDRPSDIPSTICSVTRMGVGATRYGRSGDDHIGGGHLGGQGGPLAVQLLLGQLAGVPAGCLRPRRPGRGRWPRGLSASSLAAARTS